MVPAMGLRPLRAVIVDNSATVRAMLRAGLELRGVQVIGEGADGQEGVDLATSLRPDVLSLDLMMPGVDGMNAMRLLRERCVPVPVVVLSSVVADGSERALQLLELGAVEVVTKPAPGAALDAFLDEYVVKLHVAAGVNVDALWAEPPSRPRRTRRPAADQRLAIVAASTGGPRAISCIAKELPDHVGSGMLVVQHMPAEFTAQFARRLDQVSDLTFHEAAGRHAIRPEAALLAAGGRQLRFIDRGHVASVEEDAVGGLRPRADVTIRDAVEHHGGSVVLVVLTGMGRDGLEGARAVRRAGGMVIAECRTTALIHGMPGSVIDAGLADEVLPLPEIADAICRSAG